MPGDFHDRAHDIRRLALLDSQTGLPNRLGVEQHLIDAFGQGGGAIVVAALGLDDGGEARSAADAFALGEGLIVGRLGAESLALAFALPDAQQANARLFALLDRPGAPAVAGYVVVAAPLIDAYALLDRAERALARARAGGVRLFFFDGGGVDEAEDAALVRDLLDDLQAGEISLAHQPKRSLVDGRIVGVECLVRWNHLRRGAVSPDWFVPVAEARGAIAPLTMWTLGRAIADQRVLRAAGHDIAFSVNVSAALLDDRAFAAEAIAAVNAAGARLCFEITETAVMKDPDVAYEIAAAFMAAGIEVSIDDFGARLSSLSYLMQLPAQELKIDKRFVSALDSSAYDRALVKSMIDLAHDLGLKVTGEGVETAAALHHLAALGCDVAQGNFIAAPLGPNQLHAFLAG